MPAVGKLGNNNGLPSNLRMSLVCPPVLSNLTPVGLSTEGLATVKLGAEAWMILSARVCSAGREMPTDRGGFTTRC